MMGEAVQLYPRSSSFAMSSLCNAAVLEASKNKMSPQESSFRGKEVKKMMTLKRKAYFLCCSSKKRREVAVGVNTTHLGNHILRRALLLEARKSFLAYRLKQMAATVDTVSSELRPVMEETKGVLVQLLSIEHKNDMDDTGIIDGSLVEKFESLLERCAMKEDEILNTTKAIQKFCHDRKEAEITSRTGFALDEIICSKPVSDENLFNYSISFLFQKKLQN